MFQEGRCPYLVSTGGPSEEDDRPTYKNRCRASGQAEPISLAEQASFCLSAEYRGCPRLPKEIEWSDGRMVEWSDGQMVEWSDGRMVGWSDGQMVEWSDGRMVGWSNGQADRPEDQLTDRQTDQPTKIPTDQPTKTPTDQPTKTPTDQNTDRPKDQLPLERCFYLGLERDRTSSFLSPSQGHLCYAVSPPQAVLLEDQERFCFSTGHRTCPRFSEPGEKKEEKWYAPAVPGLSPFRLVLWLVAGILAVAVIFYYASLILSPRPELPLAAAPTATRHPLPLPPPHAGEGWGGGSLLNGGRAGVGVPTAPTSTPAPTSTSTPYPLPTPPQGAQLFVLTPAPEGVGWVASYEEKGNHFGDYNIHAGIYGGYIHHGVVQFDLSAIPPGSPIHFALLELTGLSRERLGRGSSWKLGVLESQVSYWWDNRSYQDIHEARMEEVIPPVLESSELDRLKVNTFVFKPAHLKILEDRLFDGKITFRIDGPSSGNNALFSWDSGWGSGSLGYSPVLKIIAGPPPPNPLPTRTPYFVLITSTPTPSDPLMAVILAATATAQAETTGTPTPLPPWWVTPFVVTDTPTPANQATASYQAALATAMASLYKTPTPPPFSMATATPTPTFVIITSVPTPENALTAVARTVTAAAEAAIYGTPTPLPSNWVTPIVVTSTPTPENQATARAISAMATAVVLVAGTPTPTPPHMFTATPTPTFVIITPAPTPKNVFTAVAMAEAATAWAEAHGTPTPLPPNWVTPIVVTSTPTPENQATAQFLALVATAEALTTGTPTPTPPNVFTATPTPLLSEEDVNPTLTPTPTATSTPDPARMPPELKGKILFLSDRTGEEAAYVMEPDGSNVVQLSSTEVYTLAVGLDSFSPDRKQRVFVYSGKLDAHGQVDYQLWVQNLEDGWVGTLVDHPEQVHVSKYGTIYQPGYDFDPAWSPDGRYIAYVSTTDGNEEIHVIDKDDPARPDRRLTINSWESDRHPSYSPDSTQIVFWSNRDLGRRQIWIMDADGNNQRRLLDSPYNDYDPVWVKWP